MQANENWEYVTSNINKIIFKFKKFDFYQFKIQKVISKENQLIEI